MLIQPYILLLVPLDKVVMPFYQMQEDIMVVETQLDVIVIRVVQPVEEQQILV